MVTADSAARGAMPLTEDRMTSRRRVDQGGKAEFLQGAHELAVSQALRSPLIRKGILLKRAR